MLDNRFADQWDFVGEPTNPILYGTKREIYSLCNKEFYYYLDFWEKYHLGLGLPCGKSYIYEQPDILKSITAMEWIYRQYYGVESIVKRLDGIGEYLRAGFNLKVR